MKIQERRKTIWRPSSCSKEEKGTVRAIDIVHRMEFSKPRQPRHEHLLREGQLHYHRQRRPYRSTDAGSEIAKRIQAGGTLMTKWICPGRLAGDGGGGNPAASARLSEETSRKSKGSYLPGNLKGSAANKRGIYKKSTSCGQDRRDV